MKNEKYIQMIRFQMLSSVNPLIILLRKVFSSLINKPNNSLELRVLVGLARERPRFDLTIKKPGAEAPDSIGFCAVRGVRSSDELGRAAFSY